MNDTIAAISTPPGRSALAVVRLSGADAIAIADRVFRAPSGMLEGAAPRTLRHGAAWDSAGDVIDELIAVVLQAPASYTGETMVEFTCHGGDWSAPRLLSALLAAGARAAGPGEFTERAFLNGRMDLARAEAVADVIHAESDLAHRLAARQVVGALSHRVVGGGRAAARPAGRGRGARRLRRGRRRGRVARAHRRGARARGRRVARPASRRGSRDDARARARDSRSSGARTSASRRSSTRCSARSARSSPPCPARRATR